MFYKFASNVLQDLSDNCMLRSFSSENKEKAKIYMRLAERIDGLISRINVEKSSIDRSKKHG